jgi:putative FmdB family regulatory protein
MPVYDYKCPECQATAELWRMLAERDRPVACPSCETPMQRMPSVPSFVLKGAGWARDGYSGGKA